MKILMIADNFPPEVNAPASRNWAHSKNWTRLGEKITVIASVPNFPAGRVFPGYRNRLYQRGTVDGVDLIRVWSFITANKGFIPRAFDFLSFAASSFVAGLFQRPDIIVTSSPQLFVGLSAWALAKVMRKPWVFEVRDLWPEFIPAVGMMRKGLIYRMLEALELHFYRSACAVIIVSEGFRRSLTSRGIDTRKIFTIPNGAELVEFYPRARDESVARDLGIEGAFVIGFIGTLGLSHGLDFVLDCATQLEDRDIHFLIVGDGAKKSELVRRAQREKTRNVTFLDMIPRKDVPALMAQCDAALVNLIASPTFLTVIPSKIFEAAALRCPILLGVDGVARELVEKYNAGLFFAPGDRNAFIEAIMRVKNEKSLYAELQEGCHALAVAYDRDRLATQALDVLRDCERAQRS